MSRKGKSKSNEEAYDALEKKVQEKIQEKDKCQGKNASEKNPSRIQDAVERTPTRKGSNEPRVLGLGCGWGRVLRPLFLGLLWTSLLPVSSSLAVSEENTSYLDAIKPSPSGLDVDVECHVPPGAAGATSKLEMLRDLDQEPCLQIKVDGVDLSTRCNVTFPRGESGKSCMSLFAWKGYFGSFRQCLQFCAPHVGLPTWDYEHVPHVDESVWVNLFDTFFDMFQSGPVGLLLIFSSCFLTACWMRVGVKRSRVGSQSEPESVTRPYCKKLRVGAFQLRATRCRRLKRKLRRQTEDAGSTNPLLLRRCRTYGLGRNKICRLPAARLLSRRQTQFRYCKRMMYKLQGRFRFGSCPHGPHYGRDPGPILQADIGRDLRESSELIEVEGLGTTVEPPKVGKGFFPLFWSNFAAKFRTNDCHAGVGDDGIHRDGCFNRHSEGFEAEGTGTSVEIPILRGCFFPVFWPSFAARFRARDRQAGLDDGGIHRDGCFNRHRPHHKKASFDLGENRHAQACRSIGARMHRRFRLLGIVSCIAWAVYLVYRQENWNDLLGTRIGEASNPGPPGGAERTDRVRIEKFLFQSLQEVLAKVDNMASEGRSRSPSQTRSPSPGGRRHRSPSPSAARGRSPQRNAGKGNSQESGWKVVQGPKGKGKTKGSKNNTAQPHAAKEVKFADEDPGGQLLARLKALILECEVKGTKDLLPKLRSIVGSKTGMEGYQIRTPSPVVGSGKVSPAAGGHKTASKPTERQKLESKGALTAKGESPFQWKINQVWWPGKVASAAKFSQTLDLGIQPEADLTVATLAEARQMKEMVVTHNLNLAAAVVCKDLEAIPEGDRDGLVSKYVQLHTGVWKRVTALPLSKDLPKWGTQPHVVTTEEGKACAPTAVKLVALRVTLPQEFLSEEDWGAAMHNPRGLLQACLPAGVCVRAYGWHEVPGKEPVVVGFLQVPESATQNVLSRSGFRGAFFSPLPPKGGGAPQTIPIKWLVREKGICSGAYLATAKKDALAESMPLAYRKGGRSNLGIVGLAPAKVEDAQIRKRWCAKGTPTGWTPQQFVQVLEKSGWRVLKDIQAPTRPRGVWTFSGAMPEACKSTCWILPLGDDKQMLVSPWVKTLPKAERVPIRSPGGWISHSPASDGDKTKHHETNMEVDRDDTEVPDASMSDKAKRPASETAQGTQENGRAAPKAKVLSSTKSPAFGPPVQFEAPDSGLGPQGVKLWDLHGTGDCGFRALAATQAYRNGVEVATIVKNIDKLALSLRTKCTSWLVQNHGWRQFWYSDPEANETTEAGTVGKTPDEFLESTKRPGQWMGHFTCLAASRVLQSDVLVWKCGRSVEVLGETPTSYI